MAEAYDWTQAPLEDDVLLRAEGAVLEGDVVGDHDALAPLGVLGRVQREQQRHHAHLVRAGGARLRQRLDGRLGAVEHELGALDLQSALVLFPEAQTHIFNMIRRGANV